MIMFTDNRPVERKPIEISGLCWIPSAALPKMVDGVLHDGGLAFFDSAVWEQRDGPGSKPVRRAP